MSQKIIIDPVTRIEGHAKITIHLDETGQVEDARFHVTEFRGFEKFYEGRPYALAKFKSILDDYRVEAQTFGNFPSLFMGLVGEDGE